MLILGRLPQAAHLGEKWRKNRCATPLSPFFHILEITWGLLVAIGAPKPSQKPLRTRFWGDLYWIFFKFSKKLLVFFIDFCKKLKEPPSHCHQNLNKNYIRFRRHRQILAGVSPFTLLPSMAEFHGVGGRPAPTIGPWTLDSHFLAKRHPKPTPPNEPGRLRADLGATWRRKRLKTIKDLTFIDFWWVWYRCLIDFSCFPKIFRRFLQLLPNILPTFSPKVQPSAPQLCNELKTNSGLAVCA